MNFIKSKGLTSLNQMVKLGTLTIFGGLVSLPGSYLEGALSYHTAREKAFEHAGLASLLDNADAAARARRSAAAAVPNPTAFVEYETLKGGVGNMDETTAGLSTPLDFLWKRGARVESADRRNRIAAYGIEEERRQISYQVATFFITYENTSDLLSAALAFGEALRHTLQLAESLVINGDISPSHLRRIEMAMDQLELELVDLESRRAGIVAQFSALTGVEAVIPNDEIHWIDLGLDSASEAISTAHRQRPDLQTLEAYAQWQDAEALRIRAEGRPEASLDLAYKRNNADQSGAFIGLTVELPIFGPSRSQTLLARSEHREADLQLAQSRRVIAGEVAGAFQRWQRLQQMESRRSNGHLQSNQDDAYLQSITAAFKEGEASLIEYLDALHTYHESMRHRLTFVYQLNLATIELAHLTALEIPIKTTTNFPKK